MECKQNTYLTNSLPCRRRRDLLILDTLSLLLSGSEEFRHPLRQTAGVCFHWRPAHARLAMLFYGASASHADRDLPRRDRHTLSPCFSTLRKCTAAKLFRRVFIFFPSCYRLFTWRSRRSAIRCGGTGENEIHGY